MKTLLREAIKGAGATQLAKIYKVVEVQDPKEIRPGGKINHKALKKRATKDYQTEIAAGHAAVLAR